MVLSVYGKLNVFITLSYTKTSSLDRTIALKFVDLGGGVSD